MEMPGRVFGSDYRFGYQGQFAEEDEETGYNHFELRLYDARICRWLVPDPVRQYWSPYLAMGNNPVGFTDPTGGEVPFGSTGIKGLWGKWFGFDFTLDQAKSNWQIFRPDKDQIIGLEVVVTASSKAKSGFVGSLWKAIKAGDYNTYGSASGRISIGVQAGFKVCHSAEAMVSVMDATIVGGSYETFDNTHNWDGELIFKNGTEIQSTVGIAAGGGVEYTHAFNSREGYKSATNNISAGYGPISLSTSIGYDGSRTTTLNINASGRLALILGVEGSVEWGAVVHH